MTEYSNRCSSCEKEIPIGERYHALVLHQETDEGFAISVFDAKSLFDFCRACAAELDFDAVTAPR